MKSVAAVLAFGLIAAVQAQEQCAAVAAKIPSCATECISEAAASVGCSGSGDLACQCENTAKINSAALNCVLEGCGPQTGLAVVQSASAVCACVASAGPAEATEATEAPASPASTAAAQTSAAEPEASEETSPATGGSSPAAAGAATPATSAAAATSAAPFPTVNQIADGQIQATAAAPAPTGGMTSNSTVPFTGAGVKTVASVGGFLLALGAAIVAL
ncbi:MAG: hypothetical protein Q9164_002840 [Protoblastenia rupestris]